jgi:hypothetical protein
VIEEMQKDRVVADRVLYLIWWAICIAWSLFIIQRVLDARRTGVLRLPIFPTIRRSRDDIFWFRYWILSALTGSVGLLLVSIFMIVKLLWLQLSGWSLHGLD